MYSTVLMQACSQRFKAWAYHNLDFASQWFIPSAGRIASHASLLNMTSHVCGHLHHWRADSTLRWCNRTPAACLRALVCLLAFRRCQHEWMKIWMFVSDTGNSSVVQCVLFVHNFCFLPTGNFWIQLFFPHCHIQSGNKCWGPVFGIVRFLKVASCSRDSILVLHRSHWSHFRNGFMQIPSRFCLCTIFLFGLLFVRTWYYRSLCIVFDTKSF